MPCKKFSLMIACAFLIFAANAFGQQTSADENFKLNITDKKTVETDYEAKTEVSTGAENRANITVNVGAAVRAERITLTLRNIFGDVRFRASLEKITNQIKLLRQPEENR